MSEPVPQGTPGGVESLSELLCCYICAGRLREASLCPHCSKMGCFSCIKRWVTENRANCPHCRASLTESSLIRVPLFDDLQQELEQLPTNHLEGSKKPKDRMCPQHKEKVSVYCETCRLCICHECVLWENSPHKGHTYDRLEVLLQKQTDICKVELLKLRERMKEVLNQVQCVEKKMEAVKGSKIKVRREMKDTFEKMSERLDTQYVSKQQRLEHVRQRLKGQAVHITRATRELESKIKSGSVSRLLNDNGDLREDVMQKLHELQSIQVEPIPSIGELFNEMVPNYHTGVFKIQPYMYLKQKGEEIYSKPLHMCGTVWKLKVYANGHREDTGVYLSVFLELTEGYDKTVKYQYCIEMLYNCSNKHPSRNYKKEYTSDFADGESWGYRRFYELAKLEDDGYLREDTVILRFSVRALTSHQKCRDLSGHIRRLEHKVEGLQRELKAAKESTQPPTEPTSSHPAPTQQETTSPSHTHSPGHQRSRHQHSISDPVQPSPRESDGHGRQEQEKHERERRRSQERQHQEQQERRRYEQERRHEQERRREREQGVRRREREGGYREHDHRGHPHMSMSQQPMHTHTQHIPRDSSVNQSYMSQQRHSDSRLVGMETGQQIPYHPQRRDSGEGIQRQHRRRSADPAVLQHHYETPISPQSSYRQHLAPPRGQTQPQEHLHFRQDSIGSTTDETHFGEEFGSQISLGASPARRSTKEQRPPRFEEVSGDEGGCSQPHAWGEPISHNDIQVNIPDGMFHPTSSTLTAGSQGRTLHPNHLHLHGQSQEQCAEDEEVGRFLGVDHMLGGPLSSQYPYFDHYDHYEEGMPIPTTKSELPSHTSALSQPTVSKRQLQSSVPNLSILTGTSASNLAHSQCLSQSVLDMTRYSHRGDHMGGSRYADATAPRITVNSRAVSQSYHGHLNRMPSTSDSHLNSEGVHHPGLMRTILANLKEEEPEHSPATHRRRQKGAAAAAASQSPKKCYQEARRSRRKGSVSPNTQPRSPARPQQNASRAQEVRVPSPTPSPTHQPDSPGSNPELTPTNVQPTFPPPTSTSSPPPPQKSAPIVVTAGSQFLGLAAKSSSNTSLSNLNLIW